MPFDARLHHPFSCLLAGPSGSGKTTWIYHLLSQKYLISARPDLVYYFYKSYQPIFDDMQKKGVVTHFIQDLPTPQFLQRQDKPFLLIVDDNMHNVNKIIGQLFTTLRHLGGSIIFVTQNLFLQNSMYRTMSLNANYVVVMKNPRDASQISHLAKQVYPGQVSTIVAIYRDATMKPYSYLFFDFRPEAHSIVRLRANMFPREGPLTVYNV